LGDVGLRPEQTGAFEGVIVDHTGSIELPPPADIGANES
jgi:hypothetical protein